ncbi:MAG TPA: hypothetical protein VFW00_06110 [Rhodocyclaceae bacterium]|nr:hypothetical protein [Rhodocyclaceae bacterium]
MKKLLLAAIPLLMTTLAVFAQSQPQSQPPSQPIALSGCSDAHGNPVPAVADDTLLSVAKLSVDNGKTIIRYNPKALPRLLPESRLFVFAHECARQYLGFSVDGERTAEQARQADCWAVATLRHSQVFKNAQTMTAVEDDLSMVSTDWALLPGPQRELKLASCSSPPQTKGSMQLPGSGPANDKWDACVQRCSSKLDSCGRAASCQQAYDNCTASCGN